MKHCGGDHFSRHCPDCGAELFPSGDLGDLLRDLDLRRFQTRSLGDLAPEHVPPDSILAPSYKGMRDKSSYHKEANRLDHWYFALRGLMGLTKE